MSARDNAIARTEDSVGESRLDRIARLLAESLPDDDGNIRYADEKPRDVVANGGRVARACTR
jgi:hypothetical protein